MFNLAVIKDTVQIPPDEWSEELVESLVDVLNKRYSNKIVPGVGLCVTVYDIVSTEDQYLYHGHASSFVKCKFRMVVFRPFINEVLQV